MRRPAGETRGSGQREEKRARGLAFHSGRLADCSGAQPDEAGYGATEYGIAE